MDITKKIGPWREVGKRLLVITIYSIIMALNYKSFVQAGDLFPGGFTGLTRLAQRCAQEFWGVTLPFAPINLVLNAIPAAVSFKLIGKRFTMYSCLAIVVSSIFTDLVPSVPVTEDILLICVFGGLINGFSISLCLQARITSGGTDFIAIALAERKNVNAWNYIFCGNVIMLMVAGALFGWDRALYSIIFQFASTQVIRMMDPDGRRVTLFIVTGREKAGGVCAQIQDTRHTADDHDAFQCDVDDAGVLAEHTAQSDQHQHDAIQQGILDEKQHITCPPSWFWSQQGQALHSRWSCPHS